MNSKQKHNKIAKLTELFGNECYWCGCILSPQQITLDHQIPRSKGGSNSLENLRICCFSCNNQRGNSLFPPPFFRKKVK
ncbi:HNH endonuclease signature motif containing protein [Roseofilum sp. BLCC_M91]|uniref:HNH endonuclease signature motif containing protein n=1 Tax=Roseofilum halophilum BLCC-M91 TaxID=3022259 RepID=A0ABT7BLZ8_9CYAN|nr:HNH endonuclease signature motif containing protein [Roseofilum halophilum]MDJ1180211.1 HNH endonuclease signature motif containing protein [Roseofilum halophilum BLCC-M91]